MRDETGTWHPKWGNKKKCLSKMHRCTSHNCKRLDRAMPWWAMEIPSLAVIPRLSSYAERREIRTPRAKFTSCKFHTVAETAQRASRIISRSFARRRLRCSATTSRRVAPFSPSYLRPSVLLYSDPHSFLPQAPGEKIDLPIMGNRYERTSALQRRGLFVHPRRHLRPVCG